MSSRGTGTGVQHFGHENCLAWPLVIGIAVLAAYSALGAPHLARTRRGEGAAKGDPFAPSARCVVRDRLRTLVVAVASKAGEDAVPVLTGFYL